MAAVMNVTKRTLSVSIAVSKSYIYNNVKPDAAPAGMLAVGTALGGLFDNEITGLTVVERATLTNE